MGKEQVRLHAIVNGQVQGVGFRYFVLENAETLQVTGWVRNTFHEQVEVTAEGTQEALDTLLESLRQGPRWADVADVQISWEPATGEYYKFNIAPSGY